MSKSSLISSCNQRFTSTLDKCIKPVALLWFSCVITLVFALDERDSFHLINESNNELSVAAIDRNIDQRNLQSLRETLPCIPPSVVRGVYLSSSDSRLNPGSSSIDEQCFNRYDFCGSTMAPSACCRISYELGWVVCDSANGFASVGMACVCNENTFQSQPPTITPSPTKSPTDPTDPPMVPPTWQPTSIPTVGPTLQPTDLPTPSPTDPPTTAPSTSPSPSPTEHPVAPPSNPPTPSPTEHPTAPPSSPPTSSPTDPDTAAPSHPPTVAPTVIPPTNPPTLAPTTAAPTYSPTNLPTHLPTEAADVTEPPVEPQVTLAPTLNPTEPIIVTSTPTDSATIAPTSPPTAITTTAVPTYTVDSNNTDNGDDNNLGYVTENRVEEDFVRQSQCVEPLVPETSQASTFQYTYQVIPDPDGVEILSASGKLVNVLTETQHDALVRTFLTCDLTQDGVWILESAEHEVTEERCNGSVDSSTDCLVVSAKHRILACQAISVQGRDGTRERGLTRRHHRNLQSIADEFADAMIVFVEDEMSNGDFNIDGITLDMTFTDGAIVMTTEPTDSPTVVATTPMPTVGFAFDTASPVANNPTNEDPSSIQQGQVIDTSPQNSGLSVPYIVTIVVAVAFVLLVILMVFHRHRRRNREAEDEDYLEKGNGSTLPMDQLELDSPPTNGSSPYDSHGSRDPIVLARFSMDDDHEDPFTSSSPPKRSRRGPLTSQDELDHISFDSESIYAVSNDRGLYFEEPRSYPIQDTVNL